MLNGEQSTGDGPVGVGSLRKVGAGLGWSREGPGMEILRAWMRCLALQRVREAGAPLVKLGWHHQIITLFPVGPAQSLGVLLSLAAQATTADPEESENESRIAVFTYRWASSEVLL